MSDSSITGQADRLAPYLPRIAVEWAANPQQRWRTLDASLAFVDVSGFTALSERLAAQGRAGAEEITELLGVYFTELLADAYAQGGSLLKFGGDALLLMFDGPDHAPRATRAAAAMRRTTKRVGNLKTSVGNVRLRTSAGVHSGEVHLFRVGKSHQELVVAGPTPTRVLVMEAAANAGEILISAETAASVDPLLVGEPQGPGFALLDRVGRPAERTFPEAPLPEVDLSHTVPVALRPHLLAGALEPEHRQVAVAFVGFRLDAALLASIGPASAADALDELVTSVQEGADEYGVTFLATDVDREGGKILLASGAPEARDDDGGRMLAALRRIADTPLRLTVRAGANRGGAFAGDVGPEYRRTYAVMGDVVNLAARLMGAAAPGEILATEELVTSSRRPYDTIPREPFTVKGKAQPVRAFSVGEPSRGVSRRGTGAAPMSPLVGRDRDMDNLLWLLAQAGTGSGTAVQIVGPAGIGKSRLIDEFSRRNPDVEVIVAGSEPYEQATAWAVFGRFLRSALKLDATSEPPAVALRERVALVETDLMPWAPLLADVVGVGMARTPETADLEPWLAWQRTLEAVGKLLEHRYPVQTVFVFEDVQWADDASLAAIVSVAAAAKAGAPWLVLVTRRDDAPDALPASPDDVYLRPLDDAASKEFITAATANSPLRPHRRDALVRGAAGNPLFLEELLRAGAANTDEALPDSVQDAVASGLDRLPADDRRLLVRAAVLGIEFDIATFARIAGEPVPSADVLSRRWAGLAENAGEGRMRFSSQVVHDVAYERLSFRKRRELHGRAAEAIEASANAEDAPAELLSLHFLNAGRYDKCWTYSVSAGKRARQAYAGASAARLFERALMAARHIRTLDAAAIGEAWEDLADALHNLGEYERAEASYRQARKFVASNPAVAARLHVSEARIAEVQGRPTTAVRRLRRGMRALEASDAGPSALLAELQVMHGWISHRHGAQQEALRWATRALESVERAIHAERALTPPAVMASILAAARVTAEAYLLLDWAALHLGAAGPWERAIQALPIFEQFEDLNREAFTLNALGAFAYYGGKWDEAAAYYRRAHERYERAGNDGDAARAQYNAAEILLDQGNLDEAEQMLHDVETVYRAVGYRAGLGLTSRDLGRIAAQRGKYQEAADRLEEARSVFTAFGAIGRVLEVDVWTAEALIREGRVDEAVELLDDAEDRAKGGGFATSLPLIKQIRGVIDAPLETEAVT
ncbi:MAG TPA: adenylate/guanylate cyclase domain-containing protein [Acidimicrobiales bacterium]|nr:adenylate/guanylate cyclase domain-containing protein [Acidimicrobiales bacterium]